MAVAQALANGEHLAVEAGTGVGKSLAYLVPAILYAVANKKKAVISTHTINLQEQLTQKDLPMLEQDPAGEVQLHDAQGPGQLPLHAPPPQGRPAGGQPLHLVRGRGTAAHPRMVQDHHRRQPVGFRRSSRTRRSGRRSAPSAGCARPSSAATRPTSARITASVSSSARATASSSVRRAGAEPHAVLHPARRPGGGNRGRHPLPQRLRDLRRGAPRWNTSPPGTSG